MGLSTDDRVAIYELIALHGHLMDAGEFHRLDELFTRNFVDGTSGTVVYEDLVRRTAAGWRIARRT